MGLGTAIPPSAREHVRHRFHGSCTRCGTKPQIGHWHHRRSRSVRDEHQHHPCNGVWLCPTCHEWVHAHPFEARSTGLIVSRHTANPGAVEVQTFLGLMHLDCNGLFTFVKK